MPPLSVAKATSHASMAWCRLAIGMTAGEELRLEDLLARRAPLSVREVLAWHDRLPPIGAGAEAPQVELIAAVVLG